MSQPETERRPGRVTAYRSLRHLEADASARQPSFTAWQPPRAGNRPLFHATPRLGHLDPPRWALDGLARPTREGRR